MRKLLLLILFIIFPALARSQETIVSYDKSSLSVLNEELRQAASNLRNTKSLVTTLQTSVNAIESDADSQWVDYSNVSTITGWSSFTQKSIKYKRIGDTVFVNFNMIGTSNSTGATFTLPIAAKDLGVGVYSGSLLYTTGDNSSLSSTPGACSISGSSVIVDRTSAGADDWTASGTKTVRGQFFYESI